MHWINRYTRWFEQHWATPSYGGWVILGLTAFFWLAAANTLAGWLYVLSGTCLALLFLSAWLPMRLLKGVTATRAPLYPISVGETLSLTVTLERKSLGTCFLQCQDQFPKSFEGISWHTIEWPTHQKQYRWNYGLIPQRRGQFQWQQLRFKTAAPLGLLSCERNRHVPTSVLVYPEVIPLTHCPILDQFAATQSLIPDQNHSNQLGQDGTTRSLRPYRHGDPRRLIHWRSSAKFNELRTRELEVIAGESPVIIALNSCDRWSEETFESAIIAAASLYHYAEQQGISVQLWTAGSGLQTQSISVLETLALISAGETEQFQLPTAPVLWLTESSPGISELPSGSCTLRWEVDDASVRPQDEGLNNNVSADHVIDYHKDLALQLQQQTERKSW